MENATQIGAVIARLDPPPKPNCTLTTPSVDEPPPPPEPSLPEIYAARLKRAGHPVESWGTDAPEILRAWKAMEETPGLGIIVGGKFGRGKTTLVHDMLDWPRNRNVKFVHTSSPAEMMTLDADECPEEHLFIDDSPSDPW